VKKNEEKCLVECIT